jgi:Cu(I)/Ag(I) efflux system membrane protein CusA/SilA
MAEHEYMVRGKGYLRGIEDLENDGAQVRRRHAGAPARRGPRRTGPDERRGIAELDGEGEVVGGIASRATAANALDVIDALKERIAEIAPGLPKAWRLAAVYDRSQADPRAIETLRTHAHSRRA